jgi:hypothetical protein
MESISHATFAAPDEMDYSRIALLYHARGGRGAIAQARAGLMRDYPGFCGIWRGSAVIIESDAVLRTGAGTASGLTTPLVRRIIIRIRH